MRVTGARGMLDVVKNSDAISVKNNRAITVLEEASPLLSGECGLAVGKFFAPKSAELRRMLLELRKKHCWSQADAATIFGVSTSCITKWERGDRTIKGAAAKLIFLAHSQLSGDERKIKSDWDLAVWGEVPYGSTVRSTGELVLPATSPYETSAQACQLETLRPQNGPEKVEQLPGESATQDEKATKEPQNGGQTRLGSQDQHPGLAVLHAARGGRRAPPGG